MGPVRILHVDDDELLLNISQRVLTGAGYEVETRAQCQKRVEVDWCAYDLLIIDWILPIGGGRDLCNEARESGYEGPILVLSSKDFNRDERRELQRLEVDLMPKPFGPQDLMARVRSMLPETS